MSEAYIYKGTTPTLVFDSIPYTADQIERMYVTFNQLNRTVLEIEQGDQTSLDDNVLCVFLTQENTDQFNSKYPASVQLRIKLYSGEVVASDIVEFYALDSLKSGDI